MSSRPECDSKHPRQASQERSWWNLFILTRLHLFPVGSDVCIAPCLWGILMAAYHVRFRPFSHVMWLIVLRSFERAMAHSAGCIWNDIVDRDVDGLVERSRSRPLASGSVSLRQAFYLTICLHGVVLVTLGLCGCPALYVGIVEIVFFGWSYPLMKRWTYWPQAWLGLTFGWGIVGGWLSLNYNAINTLAITSLWIGNICWTIVYDTIYACQDREDDVHAGVKSTALRFGEYLREILSLFAIAFIACLSCAGIANKQGTCYFAISVGGAALHIAWQLYTVDFRDKADCKRKFKSNGTLGMIVATGLLCDYLL